MGHCVVILLSFVIICSTIPLCNALSTTASHRMRPRTFLITGATDGIGKHTSQKLASDGGHALLVHGRKSPSDESVSSLVRDLESRGAATVAYRQADLSDLTQVERLAAQAAAQLTAWQASGASAPATPALDVLVNNAGVFDPAPRRSAQGFDATMAINVLAPYVLTRRLLPSLVRGRDARIITTSSISQSRTLPDLGALFARKLARGEHDVAPLSYSAHSFYSYSKLGDFLFTTQLAKLLSGYRQPPGATQGSDGSKGCSDAQLIESMRTIQCLTMDPGTVNTKMLLAGWGPCGISLRDANNTYKLATGEEYAFGKVENGSYHFGGGGSRDARDDATLKQFWAKLAECTGVNYDELHDCF